MEELSYSPVGKPPLSSNLKRKTLPSAGKKEKHLDLLKLAAKNQATLSRLGKSSIQNSSHSTNSSIRGYGVPGVEGAPRKHFQSKSTVLIDGSEQCQDMASFVDHDKRKMDLYMRRISQLLEASGVTAAGHTANEPVLQFPPPVDHIICSHHRTDSSGSIDSSVSSITDCSYASRASVIQPVRSKSIPESNCEDLMPFRAITDQSASGLSMLHGAEGCRTENLSPAENTEAPDIAFQALHRSFSLSLSSGSDFDEKSRDSNGDIASPQTPIFPHLINRITHLVYPEVGEESNDTPFNK